MSSVYSHPQKSYFLPNFRSVQHRYGGCIPAYPRQASFIHLFFSDCEDFLWSVYLCFSAQFWFSFVLQYIWPGLKCSSSSSISFADLLGKDVRPNWPGSKCAVLSFKGKRPRCWAPYPPGQRLQLRECQHWHQEEQSQRGSCLFCVQNTIPCPRSSKLKYKQNIKVSCWVEAENKKMFYFFPFTV